MNERIREAARYFGSMGGKAPKTLTPSDRERHRKWAQGLAVIRANKRAGKTQWRVIARDGTEHAVWSMTGGTALEEARAKGIDAVGVKPASMKADMSRECTFCGSLSFNEEQPSKILRCSHCGRLA